MTRKIKYYKYVIAYEDPDGGYYTHGVDTPFQFAIMGKSIGGHFVTLELCESHSRVSDAMGEPRRHIDSATLTAVPVSIVNNVFWEK